MTDIERDAIDANYPTYSDIVKLAAFEAPWPLQSDLADFIENLCKIMGWPVTDTFQRIHDMIQERVKPLDNDR